MPSGIVQARRFVDAFEVSSRKPRRHEVHPSPTTGFGTKKYFSSSTHREFSHSPKSSRTQPRRKSESPRTRHRRAELLWDGYDPDFPSSPHSPPKQLEDRRRPVPPNTDSTQQSGLVRNLEQSFQESGHNDETGVTDVQTDGYRGGATAYQDARESFWGRDSLDERRDGFKSPTFSSLRNSVWGQSPESPTSPLHEMSLTDVMGDMGRASDFSEVHTVTPSGFIRHASRTSDPDHPDHEFIHMGVSCQNPLRRLKVSNAHERSRRHGMRAFWSDTLDDAHPDGAVVGALDAANFGFSDDDRETQQCPTLGMVSISNAVDNQGRGLLSTSARALTPAQDWAMGDKELHPYDAQALKECTKGRSDPHELHQSQLQLSEPVTGKAVEIEAAPRPISMGIPGHQLPHSHKVEQLKARGHLATHMESQHEAKHDASESIMHLKSELAARARVSSGKPYSTPTPIGHESSHKSLAQSDSLQEKIPLEHSLSGHQNGSNSHNREGLRRQLMRHEHHTTQGTGGHQHYAGHPHPNDGSIALCADLQGHRPKRVHSAKQVGLTHRPDTPAGMESRADHVDLVAAVDSKPGTDPVGPTDRERLSQMPGHADPTPRHRELSTLVSPELHTRAHGEARHTVPPVPPQGHFQVNHKPNGVMFHTFFHDASSQWKDSEIPEHKKLYRGSEREADPAQPPTPGKTVGSRTHGSRTYAIRAPPAERQRNATSTATYTYHNEERMKDGYSLRNVESHDSTLSTAFRTPSESTPPLGSSRIRAVGDSSDAHRAAIGAGPSKRMTSVAKYSQTAHSTVQDRLHLTDVMSEVDSERHGRERPF